MAVSVALEQSARAFCEKYTCKFDFTTFESSVEEFSFLSPVNGWSKVYKMMFERMYKQALEVAFKASNVNLNGEEMLDDFEYTLIRPYVNEGEKEIKHNPYVGMDRLSRLDFLCRITRESPKNLVELYAEKYKNRTLTIRQMRSESLSENSERERYIEIAGYVQALDRINQGRSLLWRAVHPFKNRAEKKAVERMKQLLVEKTDGEKRYDEILASACEPFCGHQRINANLEQCVIHAKEEMSRMQQMNDVMIKSLHAEVFEDLFEQGRYWKVG